MERRLKERLIGASVLVMLAVIFIPMVLDDSGRQVTEITETNIPPRPGAVVEKTADPASPARDFRREVPVEPPRTPESEVVGEATVQEEVVQESIPPPAEKTADARPPAAAAEAAPAPDRVGLSAWVVQLGSFSSAGNAEGLSGRLRQAGYASFVEPLTQDGEKVYRVRVGPELQRSDAVALRDRLKANMDLDGMVLRYP